jgi:hypothetical protein
MRQLGQKIGVASAVVVLIFATLSVAVQVAEAQLPKSGTGTIHSAYKGDGTTTETGKNRMYWTGAHWGFSFNDKGEGFLHNTAWHCPAITDINNNMMTTKGSCALTDADGHKIYVDWTGKGKVGGEFKGDVTMSDGTGKYVGIKGGWDFRCMGVGTDGQLYCHQKFNYKLPQ